MKHAPAPGVGNSYRGATVLGLPGYEFGSHAHEQEKKLVNPHRHECWEEGVGIRWENDSRTNERIPTIRADYSNWWPMLRSDMETVEKGSNFEILNHGRKLIANARARISPPVFVEWGCGQGYAIRDLAADPIVLQNALVFGYADLWDQSWNQISGVKFLFLVKEHLAEYFRRSGLQIDFMFTYGGMNRLSGADWVEHLRDLATVMPFGALIVFSRSVRHRPEFEKVADLFEQSPGCSQKYNEGDPSYLIRK